MTSRPNRNLWWIALAAAFMAVPAGASAETPAGKQGHQGARGARAEQQASGTARAEQGTGREQAGAADEAATASYATVNATFSYPLSNQCLYTATVGGVVSTAEAWNTSERTANLQPNVKVDVTLDCPNAPKVTKTETIASETPMSRPQFEAELERRARITASDYAGRCVYAPDFVMTDNFFANRHVTYLCSLDWPVPDR
ncbi:hypothetical protein [Polyangium aurulentum]|uniref:hypothetical protein n=1 Tax=Polyangium aurulentum TaxID=2567896 RepID=UPI0010AEBFD6|nr:hypothetical protein [Polyangium aurulentum]UQA54998.1 hypothetical protein E8A73_026980 [Polyangium aurulentum]